MRKYGESKMTQIMMATVLHVTSSLGLRKFQADGFLLTRVYIEYPTVFHFSISRKIPVELPLPHPFQCMTWYDPVI